MNVGEYLRKALRSVIVRDVMTPVEDLITVKPDEDIVRAFETMINNDVGCLPVVDEEGKLLGIVTRTNLGAALLADDFEPGTRVEDVMERDVVCCSPKDTLLDVLRKMRRDGEIYNQLPVTEDDKLVGIVTDGDVLRWMADVVE